MVEIKCAQCQQELAIGPSPLMGVRLNFGSANCRHCGALLHIEVQVDRSIRTAVWTPAHEAQLKRLLFQLDLLAGWEDVRMPQFAGEQVVEPTPSAEQAT